MDSEMPSTSSANVSENPLAYYQRRAKDYFKTLLRCTERMPCSFCGHFILPIDYEKHCRDHHNLDPKRVCVWCRGSHSWPANRKNRHSDHLLQCFQEYHHSTQRGLQFYCPARDPFGRSLEGLHLEPIWPLDLGDPAIVYDHPALNRLSQTVHLFQENSSLRWYHIMVSQVALPSFLQAMDESGGQARTSTFSCWCDGGSQPRLDHRQHRHMLLAAPSGHFKSLWAKVTVPRRTQGFTCKRYKQIVHVQHLINALIYVSKRESRCKFSFEKKGSTERKTDRHFYNLEHVPLTARYVAATLWEKGTESLMLEKYRNLSGEDLQHVARRIHRRWGIPYHQIPGRPHNVTFTLTAKTSHQFFYLGSERVRLAKGRTRTVRFFEELGEEIFYPPRNAQLRLNDLAAFPPEAIRLLTEKQTRIEQLEAENEAVIAEFEQWKAEHADFTRFKAAHAQGPVESPRSSARVQPSRNDPSTSGLEWCLADP